MLSTGTCATGYQFYGSQCYKFVSERISWTDAEAACIAEGGNLASIPDQETNDFLTSLTEIYAWVGGRRLEAGQNVWGWTDGTEWSYTNWGPGQPDNLEGSQDYIAINHGGVGLWDDGSNVIQNYICQRKQDTCKSSYLVVTTEDLSKDGHEGWTDLTSDFVFKMLHNDKPLYTNPGGDIYLFFSSNLNKWVVDRSLTIQNDAETGLIHNSASSLCPPTSGWEYLDNRATKPSVQAGCASTFSIATSEDLSATHDWWIDLSAQYSYRTMFNGRYV